MKRIVILGSSGAGKSTLGQELSTRLQIPVIHLDKLYWSAGWKLADDSCWKQTILELCKQDYWIMDGNFRHTIDIRLQAADTIIFLDRSNLLCLWRAVVRRIRFHRQARPYMAKGCQEQLTWQFIKGIWNYSKFKKPFILKKISQHKNKKIYILRSNNEIKKFLDGLSIK